MMAAELKWRQKDITEALDVMTQFDFEGLITTSKKVDVSGTLYTIRRPAKGVEK